MSPGFTRALGRFGGRKLVAVAVVVCGACGSSESGSVRPSDGYSLPAAADVPAEQQEFFEDQVITLAEYQSGFAKFEGCVRGAGGRLDETGRDEVTGVVSYQTSSDAPLLPPGQSGGSVENDCYQRFFVQTEIAFQLTDPVVLGGYPIAQMKIFDETARVCLDHIGVPVPSDLVFMDENWNPLNDEAYEAMGDGRCPPSLFGGG